MVSLLRIIRLGNGDSQTCSKLFILKDQLIGHACLSGQGLPRFFLDLPYHSFYSQKPPVLAGGAYSLPQHTTRHEKSPQRLAI